ncbi:uncharacterized protein LOC129959149 isoform X1 [Argiope bruennichi]|uniref:Uncharacterized protein n=1 Tax=Argiope bruennichi TaxID=94029 RepID=A0A8T0F119_ARGBR|nr:uncharacterized protein LOC129959149 isoform X1 [Argiope bruennichi]KAF8784521.1 hypothetical protein HNY73_010188 [Argiope bruennichi]
MCCSPYVATIVAGVLCLFQCFANLCWNIPLIIGLSVNKTEIFTLTPIDITEIERPFAIYGVTILLAIANLQLLIFSCLLIKANHTLKTDWIVTWCTLVLIKSFLNIILGIYFIWEYAHDPEKKIANFRLGILLSGIFFFWPTVNICLFIMVCKRYRDITSSRLTTSRTDSSLLREDSQPPPYSPGSYISQQQNQIIDPAPVTGWSHQPILSFDGEERLLSS